MSGFIHKLRSMLGSSDPRLRLYQMQYCYYCRRVERAADRMGVRLTIVDVYTDRAARERLRECTGRTRVPVLGIIDDSGKEIFLSESDDIISYLRTWTKAQDDESSTAAPAL